MSKRVLTWVAEVIASDLTARMFLWLASLVFAGTSFVIPDQQSLLIGASSALACSALFGQARQQWNYRGLDFVIVSEKIELIVQCDGRKLLYRNSITLRARRPGVSSYTTLMGWGGSQKISQNNCKPFSRVGLDVDDDPSGAVRCRFTFGALRRFKKQEVGLTIELDEPQIDYATWLGYATSAYMWSARSKLSFILRWDDTNPVETQDVEAFVYRSRGEAVAGNIAPLRELAHGQLHALTGGDGRGIKWTVAPVHPHRYYLLKYGLRKPRTETPRRIPESSSSPK